MFEAYEVALQIDYVGDANVIMYVQRSCSHILLLPFYTIYLERFWAFRRARMFVETVDRQVTRRRRPAAAAAQMPSRTLPDPADRAAPECLLYSVAVPVLFLCFDVTAFVADRMEHNVGRPAPAARGADLRSAPAPAAAAAARMARAGVSSRALSVCVCVLRDAEPPEHVCCVLLSAFL